MENTEKLRLDIAKYVSGGDYNTKMHDGNRIYDQMDL